MNIQTERIKLEPLGTKHFNTTCRYSTDPENTKMMCFLPCDSDDEVMNYLRKCEIQWTMETPEYLDAAKSIWKFTNEYIIDKREGAEWHSELTGENVVITTKPIVDEWKCPYHNGRMCIEMINRLG